MIRPLLYLRVTTWRNLVRFRLGRLRQPRYLLGALAAAAYFYFYLVRAFSARSPGASNPALITLTIFLLVFLVARIVGPWLFPAAHPPLPFSLAEIDFLFPAPIRRRTLVHFGLVSAQAATAFSALFMALIYRSRLPGAGYAQFAVGWWMALSIASLHRSGVNLTYAWVRGRGGKAWLLRAAATAGVLLAAAAVYAAVQAAPAPSYRALARGPAMAEYFRAVLGGGILSWALFPFRLVIAPLLAPDGRSFLAALGPAAAIWALHYLWVFRLELSPDRVAWAERLPGPRPAGRSRARRDPFRLRRGSPPELAFLWKNLLSVLAINWRIAARIVVLLAIVAFFALRHASAGPGLAALLAAIMAFYVLLIGPQLARQDLRQDLANLDLLKGYPLPGWRIVLGEILAPVVLLSLLAGLFLGVAAAVVASTDGPGSIGLSVPQFAAILAAGAVLLPVVCALEVLLPNALAVCFPSWAATAQTPGGGAEMMGQRLILTFGLMLVTLLALAPAGLLATLVFIATQWVIGPAAAVLPSALTALVILGAELACGLWWVGGRLEKLDLSRELRP